MPKNLLFICSENKLRSPTAESVFLDLDGFDAISAGTNMDSETPVSGDLIEWADYIFVMESTHRNKVTKKFGQLLKGKRVIVLDIPDNYSYLQPELIELVKARVLKYF